MKPIDQRWRELETKYLAQGETGTNSKRPSAYIQGVYPTHMVSGRGCYVTDAWGNRYIDFVGSLGSIILGHNHPKVTEAVHAQLRDGVIFSLPHPLETQVAELIRRLVPVAEKVRFFKNGDDATTASVRIARAWTGEGWIGTYGYHGRSDIWTSLTPPALGVVDTFKICNPEEGNRPRITICEPVQLDYGKDRIEWLEEERKYAKCLIFDEIVTGTRVPKLTVSTWFGVKPDIICLGKGIANGFPLSVVAGRAEVMDCGEYFLSSTFSGDCIALAACKATLEELEKRSTEELFYYANRFQNKFNEICKPIGTNIKGYGTRGQTDFYENENTVLLFQELVRSGVFMGRAFFYNWSHLEEGVEDQVLNLTADCVSKIKRGMVKLEGTAPKGSFKR
jgi:glutamate-1-semialdehyde 2,1-aminomutase